VRVVRVQAWRAAHPGDGRGKRRKPAPMQGGLFAHVSDLIEETVIRGEIADIPALHDLSIATSDIPSCQMRANRSPAESTGMYWKSEGEYEYPVKTKARGRRERIGRRAPETERV